jgi:hypothetical protein
VRKSLIACVAVVLVLVGGLVALLRPMPPFRPVSRENVERVVSGMTRTKAYAVIGVPPGDYRSGPRPDGNYPIALRTWEQIESWETDEWMFSVCFNDLDDGKITFMWFEEAAPYSPGPVELARWRLRKLGALLP